MQNETEVVEAESEQLAQASPSNEISKLLVEEQPEIALARLEKIAELAPRWESAIRTILLNSTFPADWQKFDNKMCLSSAGAMRVAKHFGIRFIGVKWFKEDFTDEKGKGYRFVYEGHASMGDRLVYAQGNYSTRDKFLGYANGDWRDVSDINEGNVRNASYHIFMGNAVKELLGLRAMPEDEFNKIMSKTGQKADKAGSHSYSQGSQGGTSKEQSDANAKLGALLIEVAKEQMQFINTVDENKGVVEYELELAEFSDDAMEIAKLSCKALTAFWSKKDSKLIEGSDSCKLLGAKRAGIALKRARELWTAHNDQTLSESFFLKASFGG